MSFFFIPPHPHPFIGDLVSQDIKMRLFKNSFSIKRNKGEAIFEFIFIVLIIFLYLEYFIYAKSRFYQELENGLREKREEGEKKTQ